jgi:hypothetical protein
MLFSFNEVTQMLRQISTSRSASPLRRSRRVKHDVLEKMAAAGAAAGNKK